MLTECRTEPTQDKTAPAPPVVDRGAILTEILQRQALRREAKLPLLDVRAEYARAVEQALWSAHVAAYGERVRAEVLAELWQKHGRDFRLSGGGLMALRLLTSKRLTEMFEAGW